MEGLFIIAMIISFFIGGYYGYQKTHDTVQEIMTEYMLFLKDRLGNEKFSELNDEWTRNRLNRPKE